MLAAKALGLLFGIKKVVKMEFSNIQIESDSAILVNAINNNLLNHSSIGIILDENRDWMQRTKIVSVSFISRSLFF